MSVCDRNMVVVIKIQGQVQQSTESLWSRCKRTLMIHLTTRRMTNTRNHGEKRPTVTLLNECKSPPEKIFTTMCILHLWQSTILQSLELFILQILELLACLRIYPLFQFSFLLIFLYSYHCIFFHKQRGYLEWLYIDDTGNTLQIGKLEYVTKHGKKIPSFVKHVPPRDFKSTLCLVVNLFLEQAKISDEDSNI